jgi:hypothetical protein
LKRDNSQSEFLKNQGMMRTERSEIANPAGLPEGCERGEQQSDAGIVTEE